MIGIFQIDKLQAKRLLAQEYANLTVAQRDRMDRAIRLSSLYAVFNDGVLIAIWGTYANTILSDEITIWLHVTANFKGLEFSFIRHSQIVTQRLLQQYTRLVGICEQDNRKAQRWLKWLGARFDEGDPKPFVIERQHG